MPEAYVQIGDFHCFPLADGDHQYPKGAIFPGRSDEDLAEQLGPGVVPPELRVGYSGLLIDTGRQRILIDTGAGPLGPATGRLPESLSRCGFSPHQIDLVVLSHLHADHIGGLLTSEGALGVLPIGANAGGTQHCCWATAIWKRPRSICTSPSAISTPPRVRWMRCS